MPRTLGLLICIGAMFAVAACTSPAADPAAAEAPSASAEPTNPLAECVVVAHAVVVAVNEVLTEGYSVPDAVALPDDKSGMWLVSGPLIHADGNERPLGLWAADGDVRSDDFAGELRLVSGATGSASTDLAIVEAGFDPERAHVHGCYSSSSWRK